MKVELIDTMGDDLMVVNAARVSYAKHHVAFEDSDAGLLRYLARNGHWSPFSHPQASFRISANIAVARQLYRHQVGLTVNETSRRYVTDAPEFDLPDVWRSAPGKGQSKQGSGEPLRNQEEIGTWVSELVDMLRDKYDLLLQYGVAPEQARLVLPMALVTEWYWTGSLLAFIRVCYQRLQKDVQQETFRVIIEVAKHLQSHFPESVKAWKLDAVIADAMDAT